MAKSKKITICDLNDLMPSDFAKPYFYTEDEENCQVTIYFPTRASVYQFIKEVTMNIANEIQGYEPNAPMDDSTYDIQNALEELVKVDKLGSEESWD